MNGMAVKDAVALVTGASRGIGRAIAERMLERGAGKVYAGARDPRALTDLGNAFGDRLVPLRLDVTDAAQVQAATSTASDLQILVNNAGVARGQGLAGDGLLAQARAEMEVNYFAPLELIRTTAPVLKRNGGGAVVNLSSVGGLTAFPFFPTYAASKAAIHSLTQGARMLLAGQGTRVVGVYPGPVDTDMAKSLDFEKASPRDVADAILDGLEQGLEDVFPDPFSRQFGQVFQNSPKKSEQEVAAMARSTGETDG